MCELIDYDYDKLFPNDLNIRNTSFIYRDDIDLLSFSEKKKDLKDLLVKVKVNNSKRKNNFEVIRNKYEFDETDNIITPNTSWFLLKPSKIDVKMNRYKLNPGEIIKIGRITMRIRDIIFSNKKNNQTLNESYNTNYNVKEIQTLKTEGDPYTIKKNENDKNEKKSKNLEKTEKIIVKKNGKKNNAKEIFTKLEKKNKVCRICYMEEEEENEENPLIQPCICSGSMKFIHLQCLKQWIGTRSCIKIDNSEDCSIFLIKPVECELCKTKFPDYIKHEGILYPLLDFKMEFESYLTLESLTLDKQKNKFIYVISLEKSRKIKVGRGHESNVLLSDISVSRIHCYMVVENKSVFLEDNDSKFGTLVLVQTPSIKIVDDLPLYIQIGRTYFSCKVKKPFKLFNCCEAEEKHSIYYYYNQNEKYIKENLGMVVKPDISDSENDEEDNMMNNTLEQKYPLDIANKYKVNSFVKLNEGDKMSDNEYLMMKHNKRNRDIKKTMIYNEDTKNNEEEVKNNNEENKKKEEENEENIEVEEDEEIEDESGNNNENNATASLNNLDENQSITVSENDENNKKENESTING